MLHPASLWLTTVFLLLPFVNDRALAQRPCNVRSINCDSELVTISETPRGLSDGKNRVFTLSLTPARTSHILVFKTGLELRSGTDYTVDGRRILMSESNVPQAGEVVTAVYSPASRAELKEANRSVTPGAVAATPSGDIADRALREALDVESRAAMTATASQGTEISRALKMIEDQQHENSIRPASGQVNPGFDGLGDRSASSSMVGLADQESRLASVRLPDGKEVKALEMLNERLAHQSQGKAHSREPRTPAER
jgi:hypothetical protein